MALTISVDNTKTVTLDDYIEYVTHHVNLEDLDSILDSAPVFRGLMNDRMLISNVLNEQLRNWRDFQTGNNYTAQTFMLGVGPNFVVRANIWSPPDKHLAVEAAERDNFYYHVAHDHNFTFMTGGYLGSGYRTTLWEYAGGRIAGLPGERVNLNFVEETTLPEGKVMVYRKSVDVHSQGPANDFSVSLNLLAITSDTVLDRSNQYIFDTQTMTVKQALSSSAGRVMLTNLARYVGNNETKTLLGDLLDVHPDERVRAAAGLSLCHLCPSESDGILERMLADKHGYVRGSGSRFSVERTVPAENYAGLI
jgi:hypothetical protein